MMVVPRPDQSFAHPVQRLRLTEGFHHRINSGLSKWRDGCDHLTIGGLCGPFHTMVNLM
jgi:hypothetical protein